MILIDIVSSKRLGRLVNLCLVIKRVRSRCDRDLRGIRRDILVKGLRRDNCGLFTKRSIRELGRCLVRDRLLVGNHVFRGLVLR